MRRLMGFVLCSAMLFAFSAALAQEAETIRESGGYQYVVQEDGTAKITGYIVEETNDYNGSSADEVTFPNRLDGYTVTAIGDEIFQDDIWVESVFIPETIVVIGSKALSFSSVENIFVLPGNPVYESVGGVLYDKTKKMLHSYPGGRRSGSYSVRRGTTAIGDYAFYGAYCLKTVELPETLLEIGVSAFSNCIGLTEAVLPEGLLRIGKEAFYYCQSLTKAAIPASVSDIGAMAFSWCRALDAFSVEGDNPAYTAADGVLFSKNGKQLLAYPGNKKDAEYTVPSAVESISEDAFAGSVHLKKARIHENVKCIGAAAFRSCQSLTAVKVAEGNGAYYDEDGVLFDAANKRLEAYPAGRTETVYTIPSGTLAIGKAAFAYCTYLEDITIPISVLTLGEAAFYQCYSLQEITLPAYVRDIGHYSFSECYSLFSVTIPDSVKEIGEGSFESCGSLTVLCLPEGLESIGFRTFGGCMSLMGLFLPASVTQIDKEAFWGCEQLILEVMQGSAGYAFAQASGSYFTIHPNWLK